jgi:hypothetical protein
MKFKEKVNEIREILQNPPMRKLDPPLEEVDVDSRTIYTYPETIDYELWEERLREAFVDEALSLKELEACGGCADGTRYHAIENEIKAKIRRALAVLREG